MKKIFVSAVMVCLFVLWAGMARGEDARKGKAAVAGAKAPAVAAVPGFPGEEEFTALRMAFAAQPGYSPFWKMDEERDAVMKAARAKDYKMAVELAKAWLVKVPVDAEMHYLRGHFLKKTGDVAGSMYHFHCFYGLMRSITAKGDGKTAESAWKVISVAEEYALLNELDAQVLEQSLEGACDRLLAKMPDGSEREFYFDVSISLAATANALGTGKKE
ncbi:DUF4919 domain-containing protein [Prosthecobacter vanneervenii]|uniref:DUF4919 domain-containing protein n=1 Tax=Prosthecobacter vanneervenii TaxID=48466 RepID=A0A7W7Y8E4_9BACT|nr:DUF4919 domain-containing protein [Prosthecobacter vanneervenii]MBB5031484.1 hypothetical protein [Prosthecobacter vanneervenii]